MGGVDPQAVRFALSQIRDGNIFEQFGLDFLSKVLGYQFIPAGGLRDRGIDGLEHTFHRNGFERTIYQLSIEKDYKGKISDSLDKLKKNNIQYSQFIYVTNIPVPSLDLLVDQLIAGYKKAITIYDCEWLVRRVNDSEATVRSFQVFIDSYLHQFNQPGQSCIVANLVEDPRLYVFLRQQWETRQSNLELDKVLADTLILYALEGTDPDKGLFRNRDEILNRIQQCVKFDPRLLYSRIDERLRVLSTKPRRINYHKKQDAYCLRLEERLAIQTRNLNDAALYEDFQSDMTRDIATFFPTDEISVCDSLQLVEELVNALYYRQGLEFANFVLGGGRSEVFEKSLHDIVSEVVDKSKSVKTKKETIKSALLATIRNIVYCGTNSQKSFLRRLSNTYLMLFLLQCDPKLATYFSSLAGKLQLYVCTSIIIPALSERFLEARNRRYTNLLHGAIRTGVKLWINEAILRELAAHFRMIRNVYRENYKGTEDLYTDELAAFYIPHIMIRAYFYTRARGQIDNFEDFIDTFVSPDMKGVGQQIADWLRTEFGIEYVSNSSLGIHLDEKEVSLIQSELAKSRGLGVRGSQQKAQNDAEVILTVHELRELGNELSKGEIFGYRTWWLSSDVLTQRAVASVFRSKYRENCYMRPDFLYNYISLAPSRGEIDQAFAELFPTLLGVNISFQIPGEVVGVIKKFIKEHQERNPARLQSVLRELIDKLKQDPSYETRERLVPFLDKQSQELASGNGG
jgi:hypothetical protein